jgi:hypothetical protein
MEVACFSLYIFLSGRQFGISFRKGVLTLARGKLMYANNAAHVVVAEALRSKVISSDL